MLTIEQSKANCKASFDELKLGVNGLDSKATIALVNAATHAVAFKCPHEMAKVVTLLDDNDLTGHLRAVKKFALDFTGVSLKGENPSMDDKRHEASKTICAPELERLQELGLIAWYEQATGKKDGEGKSKSKLTKMERAIKALKSISEDADNADSHDAKAIADIYAAYLNVKKYNPNVADDMVRGTIGRFTKTMLGCINNLQDDQSDAA